MDKYHYRDSFSVDYTLDHPITEEYANVIADQVGKATAAVYGSALSTLPDDKIFEDLTLPDNDSHISVGWISAIEMVENEEFKLKRYGFNRDGDLESRDGHVITHTAFIGSADHPSGIFIPFNGDEKANIALAVKFVLGDEAAEALEAPKKYKELQ